MSKVSILLLSLWTMLLVRTLKRTWFQH